MFGYTDLKYKVAVPILRKVMYPFPLHVARNRLSKRYICGSGIEIGGLHFPLYVRPDVKVLYGDLEPGKFAASEKSVNKPDIYTDLETMRGVADRSQNFVIANHVLEHTENPIKAMCSVARVLRPNGVAFIALPNKIHSFDKPREVTPLQHVLDDFTRGPEWSREGHYRDWVAHVDPSGDADQMLAERTNIHFHVWDYPAMIPFFERAAEIAGMRVEHHQRNASEAIWILRR